MIYEYNVKRFCCEDISLIDNYDEAINSEQMYDCHHKLEIELNKTKKELIDMGLYWKRPANELIFMTRSEHRLLHYKYKQVSEETRLKHSIATKKRYEDPEERRKTGEKSRGEKNGMYGYKWTKEQRDIIAMKLKGQRLKKYKWLTPSGEIKEMCKSPAVRCHPDWILLSDQLDK